LQDRKDGYTNIIDSDFPACYSRPNFSSPRGKRAGEEFSHFYPLSFPFGEHVEQGEAQRSEQRCATNERKERRALTRSDLRKNKRWREKSSSLEKNPAKAGHGTSGATLCPSFLFLAHRSSGSIPVQRESAKKKRKKEKRKERNETKNKKRRSKTEAMDLAVYLFREALSSFSRGFGQPLRMRT